MSEECVKNIKKEKEAEPDGVFLPPIGGAPPRIDLRTIKREIHEKKLIDEKKADIRRKGSWFCNICNQKCSEDLLKHSRTFTHRRYFSSRGLRNVLNAQCGKELIIYDGPFGFDKLDIKKELSVYGRVDYVCINHPLDKSMIVVFCDDLGVYNLARREYLEIFGKIWSVTYGRPSYSLLACDDNVRKLEQFHKELLGIINVEKRFYQQICFIVHALQPSMKECNDIIKFHTEFSTVTKHVVSMIFSGLELSGSDIEMTVQFAANKHSKEMKLLIQELISHLSDFSDNVSCDQNVPSINLIHRRTNQKYTIYINDFPKLQRSALLQTFASLHACVKLISVFTSYWIKRQNLDGEDGFNHMTIMLLVVYYLQQLPDPILPSVVSLQSQVEPIMVLGWNINFESEVSNIPRSNNSYNVRQLLSGFFAYYGRFNFTTFVVSVFLGKHLRKSLFQNVHELSDEMSTYKQRYTSRDESVARSNTDILSSHNICVLDPFVHSTNVAARVSNEKLELFQMSCECARAMFDADNLPRSLILRKILYQIPEGEFVKMKEKKTIAEGDVCFLKEEKKPIELITLSDEEGDEVSQSTSRMSGYDADLDDNASAVNDSSTTQQRINRS